jgi:hypothetical protein
LIGNQGNAQAYDERKRDFGAGGNGPSGECLWFLDGVDVNEIAISKKH